MLHGLKSVILPTWSWLCYATWIPTLSLLPLIYIYIYIYVYVCMYNKMKGYTWFSKLSTSTDKNKKKVLQRKLGDYNNDSLKKVKGKYTQKILSH